MFAAMFVAMLASFGLPGWLGGLNVQVAWLRGRDDRGRQAQRVTGARHEVGWHAGDAVEIAPQAAALNVQPVSQPRLADAALL